MSTPWALDVLLDVLPRAYALGYRMSALWALDVVLDVLPRAYALDYRRHFGPRMLESFAILGLGRVCFVIFFWI